MKKQLNPWISLLKLYMCFEVIVSHFLPQDANALNSFFISQHLLAVPCFTFLSFYLTEKLFDNNDIKKLGDRIVYLYRPMLFWTIICYILESIRIGEIISYKEIICTLLFGDSESGMCKQYWYIIASIVIIIIFWLLMNTINKKYQVIALVTLITIALILEYSGLNYEIFSGNRMTEVLGIIVEMIPFAVSGLLFAKFVKSQKDMIYSTNSKPIIFFNNRGISLYLVTNIQILILLMFLSILYILLRTYSANTILYGGFNLWLLSSIICIVTISLPIIPIPWMSLTLNKLSSYTLGIYLIHQTLGRYLKMTDIVPYGTIKFDFLVFFIALVICHLLKRIPTKHPII